MRVEIFFERGSEGRKTREGERVGGEGERKRERQTERERGEVGEKEHSLLFFAHAYT